MYQENCTIQNVRLDSHYTITPNQTWEDGYLSWDAKGLLGYLLSRPHNWKVKTWQLAQVYLGNKKGNGVDAIKTMFKELKSLGYLTYHKTKDSKGQWEHKYTVYPMPIKVFQKKFPEVVNPVMEDPAQENPPIITSTELSITELEQQQPPTPLEKKEVDVVSDSDTVKQLHAHLLKYSVVYGDNWKIPLPLLRKLSKLKGIMYLVDQCNFMTNQNTQAFKDEEIPHKTRKAKKVDKPLTFLELACKDNWAHSDHENKE